MSHPQGNASPSSIATVRLEQKGSEVDFHRSLKEMVNAGWRFYGTRQELSPAKKVIAVEVYFIKP